MKYGNMPKARREEVLSYLRGRLDSGERNAFALAQELDERFGIDRNVTALSQLVRSALNDSLSTARQPAVKEEDLSDEGIAEIAKHDKALHAARAEARTWKRKYEAAIKETSLEETISELVREYQGQLVSAVAFPGAVTGEPRPARLVNARESMCLILSDLHVGETVTGEAMHGINRYDIDVFLARMERLADTVESICFDNLTGYEFEELVIYGVGDLVNGMYGAMHDELIITQASSLMETVYGLAYVLVQFLARMRRSFAKVRTCWAPGNHGRMSRKPMAKMQEMNWDMIVPQIVSTFFDANSGVLFDIPDSFFFIDEVRHQRVLGFHGHQVKGWSGIPWYGIKRFDENLTGTLARAGTPIDHIVMGHFHTEAIFDRVGGEVIAGPCMKGADEYTLSAGFRPAPAGQTMFGIHDDHGITHRWRLDLQNAYEPRGEFKWWPGGTLGSAWASAGKLTTKGE